MAYTIGQKIKNKNNGEIGIIDDVIIRQTPVGDTEFFEIRYRKKNRYNERLTQWTLDTYFDIVSTPTKPLK